MSLAVTDPLHVPKPLSLDDAAGRLLLALLHLRDTGDDLTMDTTLREYAVAGRREDADLASLETELRTLYDAVFRVEAADAGASQRREGMVVRLATCYARGD